MASTPIQTATPQVMFTAPGLQVNGLEAVAEGLWLCDQRDNHCYLVDYSGRLITSFASPARNASGVTFGAGSVWVASNVRPAMIFRHDATTGQCTAFVMLEGEGGVHGLQWRPYEAGEAVPQAADATPELFPTAPAGRLNSGPGASGTLWVSRPGTQRIEHIDAETGELLGSLQFPLPRSHGMFWDQTDNTLSVAETNGGHMFRFEPRSGELLEEWRVDGPEVHGLTRSTDGRIWIGDASTNLVSAVTSHSTCR
jgi:streptogramin lyase